MLGVWMSCTPTPDVLIIALDFEGVQSIERSAQEDTLLVLFNTAISNMVRSSGVHYLLLTVLPDPIQVRNHIVRT